jgi:uncharacterized repeat protein (TIGR01451 family)
MPTKPPGTPTLDLTDNGDYGNIGGAVFATGQVQPAGTGAFNSFVQIQHTGSEQGYNTDASAQYDEKSTHTHNHSLLLADVPVVLGDGTNGTVEGLAYREFLLDLNEQNGGAKPYISLDALQIWQEESGSLTNFTPGSGFAGAHTNYLAYNLDAGGDHWIGLTNGITHGSGQSDYRVLIPDSYFISDAAHRYVTLYSAFGQQRGWESDGGFDEWGLHGASGGAHSAFSVQKTATVDGGTADVAGEVISYAISVSNTGNTALTGITVTDPSVSNLAAVTSGGFNSGDTNQDTQLSAGETWLYTASHTVTQDDLDSNGGGDGVIQNTVTADSNETAPVAATAAIAVDFRPSIALTKTADVSSVDAAGDVITYAIAVQNNGNVTQTAPSVTDSDVTIVTAVVDFNAPVLGPPLIAPVISGDYNIGDTNQNGFEDPGETFQFTIVGDDNNNGIQDPGETFVYTNVGDTNQNGFMEPGETFVYYNVGDTNQNGVEDDGETFQFNVSHAATPVDANNDNFNDGDTNQDNQLNIGETWQYTVQYTVTQDDIDNGGVVQAGLTHDDTATAVTSQSTDSASLSVGIVQNPHVTLEKTASVPGGTADTAGEVIDYTIAVTNDGNMTLTSVAVSDPSVSDLAAVTSGGFNVGDTDLDGKLDVGESWQYSASHTVTQAEIDNGGVVNPALTHDNTASVTTHEGASSSDSESVSIVQNPHVTLDKTASVPGGTADAAGEVIDYTIAVTNDGNMTLTSVAVTDPSVSDLAAVTSGGFNVGDTDMDGKLDVGESWQYGASHTVTQSELDAGGSIDNTASVTTQEGATANDSATVTIEQNPSMTLVKAALGYHDLNENDVADVGDTIDFSFTIHNTGNITQTGIGVNDADTGVVVSGSLIASLAPDASNDTAWSGVYTITQTDVDAGYHDNTAVATSDNSNASSGTVHVVLANLFELMA